MKKLIAAVVVVIGLAVALALPSFWYARRDRELSVKPARVAGTHAPTPREGTVALRFEVPYRVLEEAAGRKLPPSVTIAGNHHFGKPLFVDIDGRYNIEARCSGPIQITSHEAAMRISVPVTFTGQVGFGGDVAKILKLDRKNVSGSMLAFADVQVGLDPDWRPTSQVSISYQWQEGARVEISHGFSLPVADLLKAQLDRMMDALGKEAQAAISRLDVRSAAEKLWSAQSRRVGSLPGGDVFLRFTPQAAQLSTIEYGDDHAVFRVAVRLRTELTTAEAAPVKLPLPALERLNGPEGRLEVPLLLHAPYAKLQEFLVSALGKQTFEGESPLGVARVKVRDAIVYPSGQDSLTVGLRVSASFGHAFFDTNGWIYLTAKPSLDRARQELSLERVEFTRALDNRVWDALTVVMRDRLLALLAHQGRIPLQPQLDRLRSALAAALPDGSKPPGIAVSLRDDELSLDSIATGPDELAVEVVASAHAEARAVSIRF